LAFRLEDDKIRTGREAALTNFKELESNAPDPLMKKIQISKSKFQTGKELKKTIPGVKENILLKDYTTFRIGGPADFFYEAKTEKDLIKAVKICRKLGISFFILGRGSNILFAEDGFRGLVVRNCVSGARVLKSLKKKVQPKKNDAHYEPGHPRKYLQFEDLDYPQEPFDTEVEVFSGTSLPYLIQWALEKNLTGLQWFSGIPGSVGGGVVYNIHGGTKLFSDYIKDISVLDERGKIRKIQKQNAGLAYDRSLFQKKKLIILKVSLLLSHGDIIRARHVYQEWRQRKLKVQPSLSSAGSVFRNFSHQVSRRVGAPTSSAGWFIEQCGLKGKTVGGAKVYEGHANFIVNQGSARTEDVKKLIGIVKKSVKKKFGLNLREEIQFLPSQI